jgi:hypothetical protein
MRETLNLPISLFKTLQLVENLSEFRDILLNTMHALENPDRPQEN